MWYTKKQAKDSRQVPQLSNLKDSAPEMYEDVKLVYGVDIQKLVLGGDLEQYNFKYVSLEIYRISLPVQQ